MEPGSFACKTLAYLNPLSRLAWAGARRKTPDELNPGAFCIVQLYPMRMVGSLEEPLIKEELWEVTTRADKWGKAIRCGIDRGPVFNKMGGHLPDWDPLFWTPVFVARLRDYGVADSAVPLAGFKPMIERWTTNINIRVRKSVEERGKTLKGQVEDISRSAHDRLWYEASKASATSVDTTTREERIEAQKTLEKQRTNFEGYYDGTKVWRGE